MNNRKHIFWILTFSQPGTCAYKISHVGSTQNGVVQKSLCLLMENNLSIWSGTCAYKISHVGSTQNGVVQKSLCLLMENNLSIWSGINHPCPKPYEGK